MQFDWVTSDTHFFHDNIVKYCYRPGWMANGYHQYRKHNRLMGDNWRERVQEYQRILHLGDLAFSVKQNYQALFNTCRRLPGDKYLILGNHDNQKPDFYAGIGFTVLDSYDFWKDNWHIIFTHYPMAKLANNEINIHGHIHNNQVDCLTKRHKNVGVDVMAFSPVPVDGIVEHCIYRAKESVERDVAPNDHKARNGRH